MFNQTIQGLMKKYALVAITMAFLCNPIRVQSQKHLDVTINSENTHQTIRNFGASGCWFAEPIGKYWPVEKKEKLAELLFSTDTLPDGSPKGIGLTAWRFNIGAGTAEQGENSGIIDSNHRVDCFMDAQGQYDWSKQAGYQWFLQQAKAYKVPDLIAFVNSPPVYYTKTKLGFLLTKGNHTNLESNRYNDFASFLTTVLQHFDQQGLSFKYISPINEPQWDWSYEKGKAKQEGSPYTNEEIFNVVTSLDKQLVATNLKTKILFPEAAMLTHLTDNSGPTTNQIETFWKPESALYLGACSTAVKVAAGHGYFTDVTDKSLFSVRQKVAEKTKQFGLEYWQTEYCLLGNGYKEGAQNPSTLDCGLFMAKVIHNDLTVGNAAAWQYWNSFEPGNCLNDTRYYLFALKPTADWSDGDFCTTGNFCALGHYSRFIRPGMQRVDANLSDDDSAVLISAFVNPKTHQLVLVVVNYSESKYTLNIQSDHQLFKHYVTNSDVQFKYNGFQYAHNTQLSARSINTFVSE